MGTGINVFRVNFTSNDTPYTSMRFEDDWNGGKLYYGDTLIVSYPTGAWADKKYQTIEIDGGVDVTNPMLISWLTKYGHSQTANAQTADIASALEAIANAIRSKNSSL